MRTEGVGLKVAIVGAGSIGSFIGGSLAASGVQTVFIGRRALDPEIDARGLRLTDLRGVTRSLARSDFNYQTDVKSGAAFDVILCCVKSGQTAQIGRDLASFLDTRALVVSLQNGVGNADVLRSGLPLLVVLGGIVGFNVIAPNPGELKQTTSGQVIIEASAHPALAPLADALRRAGLDVRITSDIRPLQWSKLIVNLNNSVSALSGVPTRDLLMNRGYRRCLAALMAEGLRVLHRAGIHPGNLTGVPLSWFPSLLRLPTPLFRALASTQVKVDPHARSSMWDDLSNHKPTEVEFINGEIVRLAKSSGAQAPMNARVVRAMHHYEGLGRGSPQLDPEALWRVLIAGVPS